ncbi:hypothetical protein HK096_008328 [Nowakowskiella sp. JEL0078]|nr:hypothetical protein HK096_008328 [Nowakowskiella sp. JEL0078]
MVHFITILASVVACVFLLTDSVKAHAFINIPTARGGSHAGYPVAPCGAYNSPLAIRSIVPPAFSVNFTNVGNETSTYTIKLSFKNGTNLTNDDFVFTAATGEVERLLNVAVPIDINSYRGKINSGDNATLQVYLIASSLDIDETNSTLTEHKIFYECSDVVFNLTATNVTNAPKPVESSTTSSTKSSASATATSTNSTKSSSSAVAVGSNILWAVAIAIICTLFV